MSQNARHNLEPTSGPIGTRDIAKMEFGRRLQKMMLAKGWNQSELARKADIGRDAVSTYVRGRSLPEPKSLRKLATALGVRIDKLMPESVVMAMDADTSPMLEIKQAANHPELVYVRINQLTTMEQASAIFDVLKAGKHGPH